MITTAPINFHESNSPHSLGLQQAMTIPSPGFDQNPLMINQKKYWGGGLRGLSFDGTGFLGTGLFAGDVTTWGWGELLFGAIGIYAIYSMFYQAKQTKYRMEIGAGRRRKKRAVSLRAKAKRLEEQTEGIF
jgi:hypothetical protein